MTFDTVLKEEKVTSLRFSAPSLPKIEKKLREVADELKLDYKQLLKAYQLGAIEDVSNKTLDRIDINTDVTDSKEWNDLLKAFKQNNTVEAPILLYRENYPPQLIDGATKLGCMKVMKIEPKVFKIRYDS
jgi:hypothetical protein